MNPSQGGSTFDILSVRNLSKTYGTIAAVNNVSFSVRAGETLVLMGPSGCGKSTIVRCINRLTEPDSGEIWLYDTNISEADEQDVSKIRQKIGFVFQSFNLIQRLTCLDNVTLRLIAQGYSDEMAREKAMLCLKMVGLESRSSCKPCELSGGQQQRVAIARAIAGEPSLLLWDEPTASLDPILVRDVLSLMEMLANDRSVAMIVVTHELAFVKRSANRVILMEEGRFVEEGLPGLIFSSPTSYVGLRYKEILEHI